MPPVAEQLPLGVRLSSGSTFADFYRAAQAEAYALAEQLAMGADQPVACLWGAPGTGKTHLLQAACRAAIGAGRTAAYLPLAEFGYLDPDLLAGWSRYELICVDDVNRVAGHRHWEAALFSLFNTLHENGNTLLAASHAPPGRSNWVMADWQSRLSWGPVVNLATLTDGDREAILKLRASRCGLTLPDEVARFMLRRLPRDMASLMQWLEALDQASLALQRRLTIPLVRQVLENGTGPAS